MDRGDAFYQWLCLQDAREDWIGDLANDVKYDEHFPRNVRTYDETIAYLEMHWHGHVAENATRAAWAEYLRKYPGKFISFVRCESCGRVIQAIYGAILVCRGLFCDWEVYHDVCFDQDKFEDETYEGLFTVIEDKTVTAIMNLLREKSCIWHGCSDPSNAFGYTYKDDLDGMEAILVCYGVSESMRLRKEKGKHSNPTVYFIQTDSHDCVKIGYTSSLASRLRAYATHSSVDPTLLFSFPGDKGTERELHRRFEHLRIEGKREWFRLDDEIRTYIEGLRHD